MVLNLKTESDGAPHAKGVTMAQAITMALAHEMRADESVVLIGEDIGVNGGVFRVTDGLYREFGPKRVLDAPHAETAIGGFAVGRSAMGQKVVAEFQFSGFMYPAIDHIVNHASRLRSRSRGRLSCPIVFRAPCGGKVHAPEHHSESIESLFTHIPGLRVVIPSSPRKAYGLLLAAIRDPDPVIFFEPTRLYQAGKEKEEVDDSGEALPLDRCFMVREGSDVTLVTWGATNIEVRAASDALMKDGVCAEIIDVATLKYLDKGTILRSVEKTGHCVIVHEAARTSGFGAEIAAMLAEDGMYSLRAPIRRVTGYDTVMPLFQLENEYVPSVERIVDAVRETLALSVSAKRA